MLNNEEDNQNESGYKRKTKDIKKRTGLHIKVSQQVAVPRMLMNNIRCSCAPVHGGLESGT